MGLLDELGGMLRQFGGGQDPSPEHAESQFDQIAAALPSGALASGLAGAFRSSDTPAFGELASRLFANSNGQQKAGLLNTLIAAAGPMLMSGAAGGLLSKLTGGGSRPVTAHEAEQVSPEVVNEIAAHAEHHDPNIIDRVSSFYSEHPTLVKTLGGAVLAVAMAKLAERNK